MSKNAKNTIILFVITLVSGLLLGLVYDITKEPIAKTEENAKKAAWKEVFPEAGSDAFSQVEVDEKVAADAAGALGVQAQVDEVCTVKDMGYIITVTDKEGYGGPITLTVGITSEGVISGVSILSISETPGLGMRATEPAFYEQYKDKSPERFVLSKDGGEGEPIDAISGASITSNAVTGAVNMALMYYSNAF